MEYDKSRVYTALNADELKVGSVVYVADDLSTLKSKVLEELEDFILLKVRQEDECRRFVANDYNWSLAYLISEPEEKVLKWTDLKIGDVVKCKIRDVTKLVTGIDESAPINGLHILLCNEWVDDKELESWEKEEK